LDYLEFELSVAFFCELNNIFVTMNVLALLEFEYDMHFKGGVHEVGADAGRERYTLVSPSQTVRYAFLRTCVFAADPSNAGV
jgi:hypothetical protein